MGGQASIQLPDQSWTADELLILHEGMRLKLAPKQIAGQLPNRTVNAVRKRLFKMGGGKAPKGPQQVSEPGIVKKPPVPELSEELKARVRKARWNGATHQVVGDLLNCGPDRARKICKRFGWEMSPEGRAAINRANGNNANKAVPKQRPVNAKALVGKPAHESERDNGGAYPAGSPRTWGLISAAPWPRYEPIQGGVFEQRLD